MRPDRNLTHQHLENQMCSRKLTGLPLRKKKMVELCPADFTVTQPVNSKFVEFQKSLFIESASTCLRMYGKNMVIAVTSGSCRK